MSQNGFLREQMAREHYQELEREIAQAHLLANRPRHDQNRGRHLVSRLGSALVALGTRLEQVERRGGRVGQPSVRRV